jgi:hypothetical protein
LKQVWPVALMDDIVVTVGERVVIWRAKVVLVRVMVVALGYWFVVGQTAAGRVEVG